MITKLVRHFSKPIKLIKIEKDAVDTYTFKFEAPEATKWEPGAYAHFLSSDLKKGAKFKKELVRELSIMSHPNENFIGFTTRIRQSPSDFKRIMLDLKPGDEIRFFKIGNHFKGQKMDKPIVLISMGVGIATFRPLILEYIANSAQALPITNINIDRSGDFVYQEELENLPGNKLKNRFVTLRADLYKNINQCIESGENIYFVVGSKAFNKAIGDYLLEKNISKTAIVFDGY